MAGKRTAREECTGEAWSDDDGTTYELEHGEAWSDDDGTT